MHEIYCIFLSIFDSANGHLTYFDNFVKEIKSTTGAKFDLNNSIITHLLINRHLNHAIKYTKKIFHDLKKRNSNELHSSGLVMNLICFLFTNRLSITERKILLKNFMKNLPLRNYAGFFTIKSWKIIRR